MVQGNTRGSEITSSARTMDRAASSARAGPSSWVWPGSPKAHTARKPFSSQRSCRQVPLCARIWRCTSTAAACTLCAPAPPPPAATSYVTRTETSPTTQFQGPHSGCRICKIQDRGHKQDALTLIAARYRAENIMIENAGSGDILLLIFAVTTAFTCRVSKRTQECTSMEHLRLASKTISA